MPAQSNRPTPGTPSARRYRLGRRQVAVDATRQRIVAATFELHATVGPTRTTIAAIAERAGVQRHTVYHHFPEIDALYEACTEHGIRETAMPSSESWRAIENPAERLRYGLAAVVAWFRANEQMLAAVTYDVDPAAPPVEGPDPFTTRMIELHTALSDDWPVKGDRRRMLGAVIGHALAFETWRSLSAGGLPDDTIVGLLVAIVMGIADGSVEVVPTDPPAP